MASEIADWLNRNGFRNNRGNAFFTSCVHRILTRRTYAGLHHYNRINSRTQKKRPEEEWVAVEVPAIVSVAKIRKGSGIIVRTTPHCYRAATYHQRRTADGPRAVRRLWCCADAQYR